MFVSALLLLFIIKLRFPREKSNCIELWPFANDTNESKHLSKGKNSLPDCNIFLAVIYFILIVEDNHFFKHEYKKLAQIFLKKILELFLVVLFFISDDLKHKKYT